MEKRSILVVDDEKNIRLTMSQALDSISAAVQTSPDGENAIEKLRSNSFSLVFLDLKMPGIDGMEVLRLIRTSWPGTRVIIITAHGTIQSAVEAMKLGAVDFIQKPFTPAEIRELAEKVFNRELLDETIVADYTSLIELTKRYITNYDLAGAREMAKKAIAADPGKPEAYNLLGVLLELNAENIDAVKFYKAALDIDPSYKPAKQNLKRATSLNSLGVIHLEEE